MGVVYVVYVDDFEVRVNSPTPRFVIKISEANCPIKFRILFDCTADAVLVVPEGEYHLRRVYIGERSTKSRHSLLSCLNVRSIASALESFFTPVIRGERGHVRKVPNADDDFRLLVRNVSSYPVQVFEGNTGLALYIWYDEVTAARRERDVTAAGVRSLAFGASQRASLFEDNMSEKFRDDSENRNGAHERPTILL